MINSELMAFLKTLPPDCEVIVHDDKGNAHPVLRVEIRAVIEGKALPSKQG